METGEQYWKNLLDGMETDCAPAADCEDRNSGTGKLDVNFQVSSEKLASFEKLSDASAGEVFVSAFGLVIAKYSFLDTSVLQIRESGASFPFVTDLLKNRNPVTFVHSASAQIRDSRKNIAFLTDSFRLPEDIVFSMENGLPDLGEARIAASVSESGNGSFCFHAVYRRDGYTGEFICGIAGAFVTVVNGILNENDIRKISLAGKEEIRRLDGFNDTKKEYDKAPVVCQFRKMAEKYPEDTAVVCGKEKLTYRELDDLSERIGAYVCKKGLGAEDVVGILIPRCIHIAASALGIQKAGCAYQPLDPTYPVERLNFMLKDSGAKLLITTREMRKLVTEYDGEVFYTEDFPSLPETEKLNIVPKPHNLFILLYTSGTTGTPKGVQIEQGNIAAFCGWYRSFYGVDHNSRIAAYASFGFDASMMDLYSALTNGAVLYIIPEELRFDYAALNDYFCENRISDVFMTTQIGRAFALETTCPTLKKLSVGGEKLVPVDLGKKDLRFFNGYGPTECTIFTNVFEVKRHYDRVPVGKVLDNLKAYVLDKDGNRLSAGALGELVIAGPQVSRGYLNRPEKTAEVYGKNPFCSEEDYDRIYRTGDIVRFLSDGTVDIIGRNDRQVKVRGFRVELTEIEEVIRRFPGITDATVTAFDDPNGGKAVAAYLVSADEIDKNALRTFISAEKPPYMVPAVLMQIDAIPYNQNQKVNKKALPAPEMTETLQNSGDKVPLNRLEKEISDLVEEVLHTGVTDVAEPLSYLGLTSISSIRLSTLVFKKYGVKTDARNLVAEGSLQTIENAILEQWMNKGISCNDNAVSPKKEKTGRHSCRLSFEQQGVYADCLADPASTRYNLPFCLHIPGDVAPEKLKDAVMEIVKNHSALSCRFVPDEKNEVIMDCVPDYVPEIPVKKVAPCDFEKYKKDFVRPFDLKKVPARYEIIECDGLYLLLDIHHLIADGSSIDLFGEELCRRLDGEPAEEESLSYMDYASKEEILPEDDRFFEEIMSRAEEPSQLIPDLFDSSLPHTEGNISIAFSLSGIFDLAQKFGVTPAGAALAATELTVSRYLCDNTSSIATISGGRSNLEIADTIGMFVNTLALTAVMDNEMKVEDFVKQSSETLNAVIRHEHYPFARLSKKFDFHPSVSYAWQVGTIVTHSTKDGELTMEELAPNRAKIPVSVFFEENSGGGSLRIAYDESMYTAGMMRGFAGSILHVLNDFGTCQKLKDVSLVGAAEEKILDSYNRPFDLNYDAGDTAVSKFRKVALTHPDKTAAVFKDKSYTYRELDELTDRLASVIYRKVSGITGKKSLAGCVVSILSGRSENAFLLPLAVLKAGCAYEPLDPSYPAERLNFMVRDSGACLLLSQGDLRNLLTEYTGETVLFEELYDAAPMQLPKITIEPSDLFTMLYTSGSTGTPKGVQIEHRNIVAFAYGAQLDGFYGSDSVTAAYASFGFDVNMADTFCTLLNGGTVHLIPQEIRMNLNQLARYFDDNGITEILMTTQVGVQFLQNYPKLKTMRYLMMGGEKLPAVHPENLSYTIINGYGPTENCCGVSMFRIRKWEPNIPIGKPMPTIHGYILDKTGHRLPAGAAGEYCLSGPQVTRGYLNRPEKTAEAYEDCPFDDYRMYHTGDIVRYRTNGDVEFVGRKDGQVKIRGFRIETKEVESVIREYPGVKDTTVQAYDYENGGKYLAAFVVFGGTLKTEELASFIKERKPAYMVPSVIMQLEAIPLTVNMKVDKKALPKPELKKAAYVAPETGEEENFCRIFGEVLGLEKVSAEDDFFALGGSSITAMKVVLAAGSCGYKIVYQDVFDHPVPRELASLVSAGSAAPVKAVKKEKVPEGASAYGPDTTETDEDGYDYRKINALLRNNTLDAFVSGKKQEIGNVLLLGATGYLGSHVLHELMENEEGRITCLVRPGKEQTSKEHLASVYGQYFGPEAAAALDSRVRVLACENVEEKDLEQVTEKNLTVINCSAMVKHFAKDNEIEKMNVNSVKALIGWCGTHDSRLVHISTEGVMGASVGAVPPASFRFSENVLYVGQEYKENQYIRSKFYGERLIYEAVLDGKLNGRVIRVGNLAPREDGHFQLNYSTNSFMKCLAAYRTLGMIPYTPCPELGILDYMLMDGIVEFSPIEKVARAVCLLARAPKECVCYIASNNRLIRFGDVVLALADEKHRVKIVSGKEFGEGAREAMKDPEKAKELGELIAYAPAQNDSRLLGPESLDNSLTMKVLYSCGFTWPETGKEYVKKFKENLEKLGFFK